MSWDWAPYVSAAERRRLAAKAAAKLEKKSGRKLEPIHIEGLKIAKSFWGKAWCDHLEALSDYTNRLPRGRTYVRNGSVLDLQIKKGHVAALVNGSELYDVTIDIAPVKAAQWKDLKTRSAGGVGSLIDLLQGKLSAPVMAVMTDRKTGLFPASSEIDFDCSCPDSASMCKHIAAVLYGIGARLDTSPELLFLLRGADHLELITAATASVTPGASAGGDDMDLAEVFGIEIEAAEETAPAPAPAKKAKPRGKPVPAKAKAKVKAKPARAKKSGGTKAAPVKKPVRKSSAKST